LAMANNAKKVALITGAYKGIGFETARQLGQKGITVVVSARDQVKADGAVAKLRAEHIDAHGLVLDVGDAAHYGDAVRFLEKEFGKLDILVNNAGVMLSEQWNANDTSRTSEETLRKTFDTNFFGVVALTAALLPLLKKSDAGRIVNVSSILGSSTLHSDPSSQIYGSKSFAYDASKTALNAYTIHLAHELKDTKIKVNSAHPGWVKTDMGTSAAPMEIPEGAKTEVDLATLPESGLTGGFVHLGSSLPW
jgi:NAD(P)-dependent dehydrogenase (short-subunit alcohol dehydrogenase family)